MNGRVYDPLIGRFMSADPFVQSPGNLQSYNRYAYVWNNPLSMTDPSGYFSLKKFFRAAVAIAIAVYAPELIFNSWAGSAAAGAAAAGATLTTAQVTGMWIASNAAAGALAGGISSDSSKGAVLGGLSGGLFSAAAMTGGVGAEGANSLTRYAAHAGAGCVSSVAGGGNCGQGAASAVFGKYMTNAIGGVNENTPTSEVIAKGVATAVAGGVGSVIAGGKFANGAETAAYGYLFNALGGHGMVAKGIRGFASLVSDLATGNYLLAEPEVWGRTGSGERFRADGVFVHAEDGRTILGGAVVVCEVKCGPTADLTARQVRVYDAISRNDFYLEGPRAASVAAQAGLTVNASGQLYIPDNRFGGTYLGIYEGSAAHLKPGGQKVNWGAIFGGGLKGNE